MDNIPIEVLSEDSQHSNDSFKNLPPVDMPSSLSSASSLISKSQPVEINNRGKRKGNTDNGIVNKKPSKVVTGNLAKEKINKEKAAKKTAQGLNKIYKPGECMKYMKVEIHPTLLEKWYAGDIEREVSTSLAKILTSSDLFDPGLVLWNRTVPPSLVSKDGLVEMTPAHERCSRGLYVMTAGDVADYVTEHKLTQHVATIRDMAEVKLTLVIFGDQEYYKSMSKKNKGSKNVMTELDLEMAIVDLLVSTGCDTVLVNQANELALLIVQFTKAIAESPYKIAKRACDEQADFYMRGDNKKCVSVDKDGNGLRSLWQQMLAVLPHSSLETSRALCARFKTPLELYETLQLPDGMNIIAELGVARSAVPGSKARRIGPEFARKLCTLFTAEDGNTLIE
ncbi:crossover junction endonuclease EME1 [Battus philenor]|uniref:crossover junction endonuclease EME1 n=1 Tax=Battus philenor TaxID=42288 RepID=UPI0035CF818C